jgi:hypothetical protein
MNEFYKKYNKNFYSQNGEDGIVEELLKRLQISSGWVCEFGAWDGIHLSNTYNLVKNNDFSAVYIEGDKNRFNDLLNTQKLHEKIIPINKFVHHDNENENSLDNILKETNIPADFDVLSIDIDGFDYHVWDSLETYKPKIVIIEIHTGIYPDVEDYIHGSKSFNGTSFLPTFKLGIKKGYKFVIHTGNMFFIRNDLYNKLGLSYSHPFDNFIADWLPMYNNFSRPFNYDVCI